MVDLQQSAELIPEGTDQPAATNPEGVSGSPAAAHQKRAASPIRPNNPVEHPGPSPRLIPTRPGTKPQTVKDADVSAMIQGVPVAGQSPANALAYLRRRMTEVSEEFAAGRLNRAQFHAIYNRYHEQHSVIEKLMERDPESEVWQQVALPGHTSFLRQHFVARVLFFALFPLGKLTPITHYGSQLPPPQAILPVLKALPDLLAENGTLPPARKPLKEGRWLVVVPGQMTISIVSYSLEPSAQQIQKIADLHRDFEQANRHSLARQDYTESKLVFPQRALFEKDTGPL